MRARGQTVGGRRARRIVALLLAGAVLAPLAAAAQTAPDASGPANPNPAAAPARSSASPQASPAPNATADIVVTARKREETVQNVPATVQVVSQQAIANTGISNLQQISSVAPGLNLAKAPTGNEVGVTIRGLGSAPGVPSFDSSVSLFVDGVYAPRSREFAASLFDVQRIEVIRGTQAALLGKNTSLGAVSLITRRPGDRFEADLRGSYDVAQGSTLLTGGVDVPITGTLRARVSGQFSDDEGFMRNVVLNNMAPRIRDRAIRGVLVWQPTSTLDVTGIVQHDVARNYGSVVEVIASTGLPQTLAALAGYPGSIDTQLDRRGAATIASGDQNERLLVDKYNLTANLTLGEHTLTSITAYSRYRDTNQSDGDGVPGDYVRRDVDETGTQFSQELRLVSPASRPFDYIVGALYLTGTLDNATTFSANEPFGPAPGVLIAGKELTTFDQDNDAVSVFGQANYKFDMGLRLTGGLRWTHEEKSVDLGRRIVTPGLFSTVIFPPYAPFRLHRAESNVDYSVGVQYQASANALLYASYGQGTKGGGYAQSVTLLQNAEYAKEVAHTAEVGVKLQDRARRWVINLAGFDTEVDGFQLVTFTGIQFLVGNTDLRSRGVELETYWYPVRGLRLFLNNTYADAKDRHTGAPIPLAPKWSGSGGFSFERPLSRALTYKLDSSVDYRSKRYYQQDPRTSPAGEAFATLNIGTAVAAADGRWEARVIGRNLTDANALAFAFPLPLLPAGNQGGLSERGRTVALQLSTRF